MDPTTTSATTNERQTRHAEQLAKLIGTRQERTFTLSIQNRASSINDEARTVELAFASETAIERWYGTEVLRCDPGAVMLDRLNRGGALLSDHNTRAQIGAVVAASARADSDRVCRATVRFSQRQTASEEFQDVKDGIRSQVSVGYMVHEYLVDQDTDTYTATRWEPLEISLVSIAADVVGSGVGRELGETKSAAPPPPAPAVTIENLSLRGAATMATELENKGNGNGAGTTIIVSEVARAQEIMELARVIDAPGETLAQELARDAIAGGQTLAEFRQKVFEKRRELEEKNKTPVTQGNVIELTEREKNRFSIRNAILADVSIRMGTGQEKCFELEISDEIAKRLPSMIPNYTRHGGILIPTTIALRGGAQRMQQRAGLDTKTATKGQELVFTEYGSFIELLRNKAMVIQLGATVLPGLQGNVAFPRQTGAATLVWVNENPGTDVAESNVLLDQVVLSPKTAQATTSYSRQLLTQAVIDVDGIVMDDLAAINALGIDKAALHGTGAPQPTGIYGLTGVNSVAFGGTVSFDKLVQMETEVASDNADIGTMAYLATPQARGKGKVTPELAGVLSQPLWRGSEVNGYRAEVTNQLLKNLGAGTNEHALIFAVWSQLMIGEWGVLEIITDPYAKKKQGMIEVTSFIMADVQARHGESFCKATGLIP